MKTRTPTAGTAVATSDGRRGQEPSDERAGRTAHRQHGTDDHGRQATRADGAQVSTGTTSETAERGHPRAGDHLRHVRRRPQHGRQVSGGPRLVRRRQPAARADPHDGGARRPLAGQRGPDRRRRRRPRPPLLRRPPRVPRRPGGQAGHPADRLPGVLRRRPGAPLRVGAPPAPAPGRRPHRRRHRRRARAAARAARRRRPGHRHLQPERARAARQDGRPVRRRRGARAAGHGHVVRLQVRPAGRRRPGRRLPLPAQPALGPGAAPLHRPQRGGARTTSSTSPAPRSSSTGTPSCSSSSPPATAARASGT